MKKLTELNSAIELAIHAALTVNTTGAAVAAPAGTLRAMALIDISAVGADADETFTFKIEGRVVAGTGSWVSAHATGEPATLVATQPTGAQIATLGLDVYAEYRWDLVVAGATPSVTSGVHLIAEVSRHPVAADGLA